jgi:hypothetical protein
MDLDAKNATQLATWPPKEMPKNEATYYWAICPSSLSLSLSNLKIVNCKTLDKSLDKSLNFLQNIIYLVKSTPMLDTMLYLTMSKPIMVKEVTMHHDYNIHNLR